MRKKVIVIALALSIASGLIGCNKDTNLNDTDNVNDIDHDTVIYDNNIDDSVTDKPVDTVEPEYELGDDSESSESTEDDEVTNSDELFYNPDYLFFDEYGNPIIPDKEKDPEEQIGDTQWKWKDLTPTEHPNIYTTPAGTVVKVYENGENTVWYKQYEERLEGTLVRDYSTEEANNGFTSSRYIFGEDYNPTVDFTINEDNWERFKSSATGNPVEYRNKIIRLTGVFAHLNNDPIIILGNDEVSIIAHEYPSDGVTSEVTGTIYFNSSGNLYVDAESIKIYY